MPGTLPLRPVPPILDGQVRTTVETALDSDWCITVSQSHVDGQWQLQFDGPAQNGAVVLPQSAETSIQDLEGLLRRLTAAASEGPGTYTR